MKYGNNNFYVDLSEDITNLEWLDLDISETDSDSMLLAKQVALAVSDWNGQGKVDPYWLLSDKSRHRLIYQISQLIDQNKQEVPQLNVEELSNFLRVYNQKFESKIKNLTILEFLDTLGDIRKAHNNDLASYFKCEAISKVVLDWNGMGEISATELHRNKFHHNYVMAIDVALAEFFRSNSAVLELNPILDVSNNDGEDVTKSASLESEGDSIKRFPINVRRL